jgi:hypothetical protein
VEAPEGLTREIERLGLELDVARAELRAWRKRVELRRSWAWIKHHDEHGWPPGDPDYEKRARSHLIGYRFDEDGWPVEIDYKTEAEDRVRRDLAKLWIGG